MPPGRAAEWRDFAGWFARQQQAFRGIDAHQAFEEIRGVITAEADGPLDRERYLALGVRQSIFADADRARLHDLYERYRGWLAEAGLYDRNLVAHDWRRYAAPRYDFIVVDEVQDLTMAQLALVFATLKRPGNFMLCGDSNQIVHPNLFSWSRVKTLFWRDEALGERQELRVLRANFRNGREATRVANTLLRIKHRRFGSIDRESNYLVEAIAPDDGLVAVLPDTDAAKRELDRKTRQSTQFARGGSVAGSRPRQSWRHGPICRRRCCDPSATSASTSPVCCRVTRSAATTRTTGGCSCALPTVGISSIPNWRCGGAPPRVKPGSRSSTP